MGNMVPYRTGSTQTDSYSACDSSTSTTCYDNYPYEDDGYWRDSQMSKEEEIPVLEKEKPYFDRVMKMWNTDGRLFKPMVWKPIRG